MFQLDFVNTIKLTGSKTFKLQNEHKGRMKWIHMNHFVWYAVFKPLGWLGMTCNIQWGLTFKVVIKCKSCKNLKDFEAKFNLVFVGIG